MQSTHARIDAAECGTRVCEAVRNCYAEVCTFDWREVSLSEPRRPGPGFEAKYIPRFIATKKDCEAGVKSYKRFR